MLCVYQAKLHCKCDSLSMDLSNSAHPHSGPYILPTQVSRAACGRVASRVLETFSLQHNTLGKPQPESHLAINTFLCALQKKLHKSLLQKFFFNIFNTLVCQQKMEFCPLKSQYVVIKTWLTKPEQQLCLQTTCI